MSRIGAKIRGLLIACSIFALLGCDARTSVKGVVSDPSGSTLAQAKVRLLAVGGSRSREVLTDEHGAYQVSFVHGAFRPGRFLLEISKDGFQPVRKEIPAKQMSTVDAVLTPTPRGTPASEDINKYDIERCKPKLLKMSPLGDHGALIGKGERSSGYPPVVLFDILESGDITNVRLKRSSGFAKVDKYVIDHLSATKYNQRPGCGVIESTATVNINLR